MMMMSRSFAALAGNAARRVNASASNSMFLHQRKTSHLLSSAAYDGGSYRYFASNRPKPVKVKRGESRRRIEPKPKAVAEQTALVEQHAQETLPSLPMNGNYFTSSQQPQTFGGMLKESFLFGIGMALAMTVVGVVFAMMEKTPEPGLYEASHIVSPTADTQTEELV